MGAKLKPLTVREENGFRVQEFGAEGGYNPCQ